MNPEEKAEQPAPPSPSTAPPRLDSKRTWTSEQLFHSDEEVLILHGEQVYRLRQTRNGKLILCK
jgi:hemin uptake protein HemP